MAKIGTETVVSLGILYLPKMISFSALLEVLEARKYKYDG